ncbi:hypothetical protein OHA70_20715 [Kribbella sp. NBC_00382]|uniref:hypothetical protein n=1 Tax=Kribbella sp. NBC_00382 TaxID=2975967 RepID=UPI002E251FE1
MTSAAHPAALLVSLLLLNAHAGPGGHDGCDTRNNVLAKQLTDVSFKAGAKHCVVMSGQLLDPYTSRLINFRKAAPRLGA